MIFMYTVVLTVLGLLKWVVARRAARFERKYVRAANEAAKLVHESTFKPGNANQRNDLWAQTAKRQYELGVLVTRRDRLEAKHFAWHKWADRFGRWIGALRHWQGRKLPYGLGVVDVWLVMYVVDYLGMGELVSPRHVVDSVTAYFTQ